MFKCPPKGDEINQLWRGHTREPSKQREWVNQTYTRTPGAVYLVF